jgi:glyoxylase-like metal-dependent hydrolase (beta-lactamase superfamily II)
MTTWLCTACGTQYPPSDEPPAACPICEDPRQYIPHDAGQRWIAWEELLDGHRAEIREEGDLLGIGCEPSFAIGQRALLVRSTAGNVLWDCIPYLGDDAAGRIAGEGGLAAIAISHPHFYTAMVEWAHLFGCPILVHELDRKWVLRPDPSIEFWSGETRSLGGGMTLIRCGGHFAGSQVLHWDDPEGGALLVGDTVQVIPDRRFVGFLYSYPNLIPLPAERVREIAAALRPFPFERIYGGWWRRVVERDGSGVVRRSVDRYARAVADPGLPS